jgi:UDPglucose 6-dehydrogenase
MLIKSTKICTFGIWHLGAVTSACLAELGYSVVGFDSNESSVGDLNQGLLPLFEPGLEELFKANLSAGRLRFTTNLADAVSGAQFVLLTIDTPVDQDDQVDLEPIYQATSEISRVIEPGAIFIIRSQVPVGTSELLAKMIREVNPDLTIGVACFPENLRLGQAIDRFQNPDLLVIGADNSETVAKVTSLLSPISGPRVITDLKTAEMAKHTINAYLATSISFANEIANLCDESGADAIKVLEALQLDSRVSSHAPLRPGLAFGGGTLARDMRVLQNLALRHGYQSALLDGVLGVNSAQNRVVALKLKQFYDSLNDLTIGVLGLTYKSGTSTLRRSPALEIIRTLVTEGAIVKAYDPKAVPGEVAAYGDLFTLCPNPYVTAQDSHALLLATDWPEFRDLDFLRIRDSMRYPVFLDTQNSLNPDEMANQGFLYQGVGRSRR